MLALSDRVLVKLSAASRTARELSRVLEADVSVVHRVLRGLEAQGAVIARPVPRLGLFWSLAPGVTLAFHPARIVVQGLTSVPGGEERCAAVSAQGGTCGGLVRAAGRCSYHLDREDVEGLGDGIAVG